MRRRDFIQGIAGSAVTWPLAARAQKSAMPVVGLLRSTTPASFEPIVGELRKGLSEEGFIEGHNVVLEQRWADNQPDRLPGLAADLVRRNAAVIVVNSPAMAAARAANPTTPLVFVSGEDPVKMGLVSALNRPDGNMTGVTFFGGSVLAAKRLELLHELVPKVSHVAILLDSDVGGSDFEAGMPSVETAARVLGLQIVVVTSERDLDAAFARIVTTGAGAVLFGGGPVLRTQVQQLIALAARHAIPVIYELRDYVEAGGLISYGASFPDAYRQAGVYAGRILKGAKPADLPIMQPTRFELVINLKTAKALGITIPQDLRATADEVIE
jgi:putative ABC transport system substrate-binding protein